MQPAESALITGQATAAVVLSAHPNDKVGAGLEPAIQIIQDATGLDEYVVYTTNDTDNIYNVAQGFVVAIMQNTVLGAAGFLAVSPLGAADFGYAQPPAVLQPYPSLQITSPQEFIIQTTSAAPAILSCPSGGGFFSDPRIVIEGEKFYGFLSILGKLEEMIGTVAENLDTFQADVWKARQDELEERKHLYKTWRLRLATFFDIPLYEDTGYSVVQSRLSKSSMVA
jgi:hypothetical protein